MKKLYKIREGKKICGVCGGVAEYFNVDPSLVRILWLAALLCAGTGGLLYLAAAIVLPYKDEVQ